MILDALTKLKRQSALTAMLLMGLGVVLLLCPEQYISALIMIAGYIMIIYAMEQALEFLVNNTTVMSYITFILAVVVGLVGLAVLVFHEDVLTVLCWIFGLLLILEGLHSFYYGFTFAKRSGRKGWSILVILAAVLLLFGIFLIAGVIFFSFVDFATPGFLMKAIGFAVLFSALVSLLRLIWIKPVDKNGGEENGKA